MESYQQDQEGVSVGIAQSSIAANTKLVPSNPETSNSHTTSIQQQVSSVTRNNKDAPVSNKTSAGAFLLSNNTYKIKSYHKQQKTCSSPPGVIQQKIDMLKNTKNWSNFVFQGISIYFNQL